VPQLPWPQASGPHWAPLQLDVYTHAPLWHDSPHAVHVPQLPWPHISGPHWMPVQSEAYTQTPAWHVSPHPHAPQPLPASGVGIEASPEGEAESGRRASACEDPSWGEGESCTTCASPGPPESPEPEEPPCASRLGSPPSASGWLGSEEMQPARRPAIAKAAKLRGLITTTIAPALRR
jgi:hypothetical protein